LTNLYSGLADERFRGYACSRQLLNRHRGVAFDGACFIVTNILTQLRRPNPFSLGAT
jgi:hypothetical protein